MYAWLSREPYGFTRVTGVISFALLLKVSLALSSMLLLDLFFNGDWASTGDSEVREKFFQVLVQQPFRMIPLLFFAIVVEEIIFRFTPLLLVQYWFPGNMTALTTTVVVSSILFGYLHGSAVFIVLQGVGGVILCLLFLKTGGLNKKKLKPLVAVIVAHTAWNTFATLMHISQL